MTPTQKYHIEGMDCADCALKIEKGVRQLNGVDQIQVNFSTGMLHVRGEVEPQMVQQRVEALGYRLAETRPTPQPTANFAVGFVQFLLAERETRLALIGAGIFALSLLAQALQLPPAASVGLQMTALLIAGYPIIRSGLSNLVINRDFNINLLMTIAAVGAVIIGETAEAATLIILFDLAEALEGYTTERTRRGLSELSRLAPAQAVRITDGREETLPVEALQIGDHILAKPGDRIAMDGRVVAGISEVNQAPITGESMPVSKEPGSEVFAGTINGSRALEIEVTHLSQENTLQRIIQMVEEAQSSRAPSQRFIDRFAQIYTPAMVGIAALVAAIPPLFFGQPFLNPADGSHGWLYRALSLLVIACPCALVISTPITLLSAITTAARRGILIKGGAHVEALSQVRAFAFDKTGTLTRGRPVLTNNRAVDCNGGETCAACEDVLALAYSLERRSTHPLAQAICQAAEERGLESVYAPAESVEALAGMGLQGRVNGKLATIGSHQLFESDHPHNNEVCHWVSSAESLGQTTMLVCDGDRVRGYLAVADEIRPESAAVLLQMHQLGCRTAMLTGDNPTVAQAVGQKIGIDEIHAGLLPQDKVSTIQALRTAHGSVAMIGDGINDAPALAAATVGIAMGGAASAQAMETADIVLMANGLEQLPFAVRVSRFAMRIIRQNITFSIATKLAFVILTTLGYTSLWLAVVADMGVSLAVTFNGMRPFGLLRSAKNTA